MRNADIVIGLLVAFVLAMIVGLAYDVSEDPTRSEDGSESLGLRDWLELLPLLWYPGALFVYLCTFPAHLAQKIGLLQSFWPKTSEDYSGESS
ncbi:MAG: hypothetical protein Q8P83_00405 [bacterium]|nr:hypothetical protein [bacterium]